jgi:hypothetical protein
MVPWFEPMNERMPGHFQKGVAIALKAPTVSFVAEDATMYMEVSEHCSGGLHDGHKTGNCNLCYILNACSGAIVLDHLRMGVKIE